MLLGSATKHSKQQNWFAVWVDFVIVVVGSFAGLQVQEWSNARANRFAEHADGLVAKLNVVQRIAINFMAWKHL